MIREATKDFILNAMRLFDDELRDTPEWCNWEHKGNYKYRIEYDQRFYPVKKIVSLATDVPVTEFKGGDEANGVVERLGFRVVQISAEQGNGSLSARELLEEILEGYLDARSKGSFGSQHPIWGTFSGLKRALEAFPAVKNRPNLRIEWSAGKGNWAKVPWLGIIDSRETNAPTGGLYCVFLFREDMTGVYITFNQGLTKPIQDFGTVEARNYLHRQAERARSLSSSLGDKEFALDDSIDLRTSSSRETYDISTIAHKLYNAGQVPQDSEIQTDLEALLATYELCLETIPPRKSNWIFQANPRFYDIDNALASLDQMSWLVASNRDRIVPGDRVFLWKSGIDAGIIAEATVLTAPSFREESEKALKFAIEADKFNSPQLRVQLHIDRVLKPPLLRTKLKTEPRLSDLSILKFSQGTNFAVTPEQASVIAQLIENREDDDPNSSIARAPDPTDGNHVWAYAPGPRAQFWEEFYREEILAIGWDELGDLRNYSNRDSIAEAIVRIYKPEGTPTNASLACDDFVRSMKPGDRVFVKRGRDEVVGYGVVVGEYEYRAERAHYRHVRRVRWERRGNWKCQEPIFAIKTLTDFTRYPDDIKYLSNLLGLSELTTVPEVQVLTPYGLDAALDGVAFERAHFQNILDAWQSKKNLILQGPPGVGKSFLARRLSYALLGYELPSHVEMVQFHQSYSYEDFVQGYRPSEGGFSRKDGIFVRFCKRASLDQNNNYVFVIDEINRSNLSKVFGELLMLIEADKRGSKNSLALAYSTSEEEQFYVPANIYVLGLMNTADRSLALVDYALRRRFAFYELAPLFSSPVFKDFLAKSDTPAQVMSAICTRMESLNKEIADDQNLGHGFMVGHSYFCGNGKSVDENNYFNVIRHEIIPLLKEYWFDDQERVRSWTDKLQSRLGDS